MLPELAEGEIAVTLDRAPGMDERDMWISETFASLKLSYCDTSLAIHTP